MNIVRFIRDPEHFWFIRSAVYGTLLGVLLIILCGCTSPGAVRPLANPLIAASCPPLSTTPPTTFGETVTMLIETSSQYNACRTAALAGAKP